jgi:sialidase-1
VFTLVAVVLLFGAAGCSSEGDDEGGAGDGGVDAAQSSVDPADPATWTRSVVYQGGDEGISTYRIPGATLTDAGTLLVFAEARSLSPLDLDPRRLVVRRSTDGGSTWSDNILVAAEGFEPECDHTDPVPVSLDSGEVPVLFRVCGRLVSAVSLDDGATWQEYETLQVTDPGDLGPDAMETVRPGPGHGIVLRGGDTQGRVVVSGDTEEDGTTKTLLLLSDDGGDTWRVGAQHASAGGEGPDPDETALVELEDGTILVSARNGSDSLPGRIQVTSSDGGESFDMLDDGRTLVIADDLTGPVVEGALLAEPSAGLAVYSSPSDPEYRRGLRLWTSADGSGWEPGPLISSEPAAYSDLVPLPDDGMPSIGLVVETGNGGPYDRIEFVRVPVSALGEAIGELDDDYDPFRSVNGRLVVDGHKYEVTGYCLGGPTIELEGGRGEIELDGPSSANLAIHLDDDGSGNPLDLQGTGPLDLRAGIVVRGDIADTNGTPHEVDLVIVNFETCVDG